MAKKATASAAARVGMMQDHERHQRERRSRPAEDPRKTVLDARRRQISAPKGDPSLPMYGHNCGIAIDTMSSDLDEALALWAVWDAMDRAHGLWCSRVIERRRHPAAGRIEMMPERVETDANAPAPDTRSADERHRDAVNAWYMWQVRIARLPERERDAVIGTMWGTMDAIRNGKVCRAGALMVDGVRRLRIECEQGR